MTQAALGTSCTAERFQLSVLICMAVWVVRMASLDTMGRDRTSDEIFELRAEAFGARELAATFDDGPSVRDLLNYAAALDRQAAELELELVSREKVRPLSGPVMRVEIPVHAAAQPVTRAPFR